MSHLFIQKALPAQLFDALKRVEGNMQRKKWEKSGKPLPAPHPIKQDVIRHYQRQSGYNVLVETGTYTGEMIYMQRKNFKSLHSIELADYYYTRAVERFKKYKHIKIWHGDSARILPSVLSEINENVIFWLDGHYSGGVTAGNNPGEKKCPLFSELEAIYPHGGNPIILIDDARHFVGKDDYPSIEELKSFLDDKGRKYSFEVETDIIRIIFGA
ncbi:MAG: hypothetical protein LBS52_02185 [Dysgonamonadaceae bacterium]|jgi:hypothetical protein|nr:hypothetical protein [Dysgonamonadaceae bacterium]